LLNVSFDGQLAPDRISAIAGVKELQRISPCRRWFDFWTCCVLSPNSLYD